MGLLTDEFENHQIHAALDELAATIERLDRKEHEEDELSSISFSEQGVKYIQSRLSISIPTLTTGGTLTPIHEHVEQCSSHLNDYLANRNLASIHQAKHSMEKAVLQSSSLAILGNVAPGFSAEDALAFSKTAEELIRGLQSKFEEAEHGLNELGKQIAESQSLAAENLSLNKANSAELRNLEVTLKSSHDANLTQLNADNSAKLQAFQEKLHEASLQRDQYLQKEGAEQKKAVTDLISKISEKSDLYFEELEAFKKRAEFIVGTVENTGLTGNFQRTSKKDREAANWLRAGALVTYFVMVFVVLSSVRDFWPRAAEDISATPFDPWMTGFKLIAAFILLIPAKYLSAEASRHSMLSERNRRIELELATIDAYFMGLPDDERAQKKAAFADKYFGQIDEVSTDRDDSTHYSDMKDIVRDLLKKVGPK
ncbi:MAG: hypothetical protein NXI15_05575 [Gammaproteobacteria bacterium]|nr:hypothetical protein [Gammaproteobacteria bacterium]